MVWREMPRRPVRRAATTTFPSPTVRVSSWPRFAKTGARPRRRGDRMNRREFVSLVGGAAVWPLAAHAQQSSGRVYRIGYLQIASRDQTEHLIKVLENGLRDLGYSVGEN